MKASPLSDLLQAYQNDFVCLGLDDLQPASMLLSYDANNEESQRQIVIEFIYKCMRLDLIKVDSGYAPQELFTPEKMKSYLFEKSGNKNPVLHYHHWDVFFFKGTQKLRVILEKHGLRSWEAMDAPLNMAFINEVFAEG